MPRAVAIASPVALPGLAIDTEMTPPLLVKVPTAVISPPVMTPANSPLPPTMMIPLTPEFQAPARLTLPVPLTVTPRVVPPFLTKAPSVILPLVFIPKIMTPAFPVMVADATVLIASTVPLLAVAVPYNSTKPAPVMTPAALLP